MTDSTRTAALHALDLIEEHEAKRLAWGLLDESWSEDELLDFLRQRWDGDVEACVEHLKAERLLVELPREWPNRYRTRMSETVRLFSRLRQLFPNRPWQTGSRLVSDLRFLRRPRTFSVRDIPAADCVDRLSAMAVPAPVIQEVDRLLSGRKLSRFQLDATAAVVAASQSGRDRGVVVSAGTGSGKTLAFYLPALAQLSAAGAGAPPVVAIYPRNELLKDQFTTAITEIRALRAAGGRALKVGAYFGPTPFNAAGDPDRRSGWRFSNRRWICPFLKCPSPDVVEDGATCGGSLAWIRPRDFATDKWGELQCVRCRDKVTADELVLTRVGMQKQPPDILFTTTEMLNQQMSDGWSRHVFGVGNASRAPGLVLLDEIHTYAGTSGAQVAYLLRRWRHLIGRPVTWVGLSATLANAKTFFADLCGLPADAVADIRPAAEDLRPQGSEYQLLLRGDPASQSALLSTTIQSLMLLRRVLEEKGADLRKPYGTKVFAFLENLDLVNRLYRQLLSAEGRDPFGDIDPKLTALANLRRADKVEELLPPITDHKEWDRDGQHWWLVERLGFDARSLDVSRTSSQDSGVDADADIVVATSSLEVGYDDPKVGAVLQHKAPRDVAQFLQRRGRAGRLQSQRPWTVVVLSDYGRDRVAFQSYETILDPSVPAKSLPLGNQAVRKMQAAMCLIEWLSVELLGATGSGRWSPRQVMAKPGGRGEAQACLDLLREVLDGGPAQARLIAFVRTSLGLDADEIDSVCWEHPRSLLLEVVPTAYRRLRSEWATVPANAVVRKTDVVARQPLPEYIPPTLFSDLELPEVEVDPPEDYDPAAETSIPVGMGINELTPGKVTLRWAVRKVRGLWVEVPQSGVVDLDEGLAPGGEIVAHVSSPSGPIPVVRPVRIKPSVPPPEIRPTSNGRLRWRYLVEAGAKGTPVARPRNSPLGDLVNDVQAFLNVDRGPLRTWRYALDGVAEIVTRTGRDRRAYTFQRNGEPAAVGFANTVDALVVTVTMPQSIEEFDLKVDPHRLRQLRTDRFAALAKEGIEAAGFNPFTAGWATEVVISIATAAVLRGERPAQLVGLPPMRWHELAEEVIDGVLLATTYTDVEEAPLRDLVLAALEDPAVIQVVEKAIPALNQDPDETWLPWLRSRFLQTVAAAWQAAAQQVCLDFNLDTDALVDAIYEEGPYSRIVLSDAVPGGGGLVEALTRRISDDPRRFDALVAAAVDPTDTEEVDPSLRRVLDLLAEDSDVRAAAAQFRGETGDRLAEWQALVNRIVEKGVARSHVNLSALSTRIFRPGSSTESDELLRSLLRRWDEIDAAAGFAVDYRAVCAFLAVDDDIVARLRSIAPASTDDGGTRAQSVLLSLLWTRATARRAETLRASNRFAYNSPPTERTLLRDILPEGPRGVDIDTDDWRETLVVVLRTWGSARIFSSSGRQAELARCLRDLMITPLEIDWLQVYPHVDGVVRENGRYSIALTLHEAPQ
ncbi:protein DpdJ [Actinokineospora sp. NPDC004072]